MTFRIAAAVAALSCVLLGTASIAAAEVRPGEYFQVSADGEMVRIYECWTSPYPKCNFRYEHPDGSVGPIIESWNEDLAKMRDVYAAISGGTPAASPAAPPAAAPAPGGLAAPAPIADGAQSCEPTQNAGIPPGSVPASDALMRQLIRDYFTGTATAGYDVSVTIHNLVHGEPFYNTRGYLEGQGATLITNGAQENAIIYPMRVQLTVCEEESQYSAQRRYHDWELYCFVNEDDQWGCGVSQSY